MNVAILIGHLADEPKTTVTANGTVKCIFRLATNREYINQQTGKRDADFHTIVTWKQLAENCAKYLSKGNLCSVRGSVQYRSYEAQDGGKRYVTEILAEKVEFLEKRPHNDTDRQGGYIPQDGFLPVNSDELPF